MVRGAVWVCRGGQMCGPTLQNCGGVRAWWWLVSWGRGCGDPGLCSRCVMCLRDELCAGVALQDGDLALSNAS